MFGNSSEGEAIIGNSSEEVIIGNSSEGKQ